MSQQINTFEVLFEHVNDGGMYLCEDIYTSYWKKYGGSNVTDSNVTDRQVDTPNFMEYSKKLIDELNYYYRQGSAFQLAISFLRIA